VAQVRWGPRTCQSPPSRGLGAPPRIMFCICLCSVRCLILALPLTAVLLRFAAHVAFFETQNFAHDLCMPLRKSPHCLLSCACQPRSPV
jgi:hypothetical protein